MQNHRKVVRQQQTQTSVLYTPTVGGAVRNNLSLNAHSLARFIT